MELTASYFN